MRGWRNMIGGILQLMGRREKKLPLPSALERKQQSERAKRGIKQEPVKKREGFNHGLDMGGINDAYFKLSEQQLKIMQQFQQQYDWQPLQPGGIWRYDGKDGISIIDMTKKPEEPKKTETENWLDQWERDNGGTDISTSGKAEA